MQLREYIAALWADWLVLMSGSASVVLAFWAAYFPPTNVQAGRTLLWVASIVCFAVASYRIWAKERDAREKEIAQLKTNHKAEIEQKEKEHQSEQKEIINSHASAELNLLNLHKKEVEGLKKNFKSVVELNTEKARKERENYEIQISKLKAEIGSLKSQQEEKPNLVYLCPQINFVHIDGNGVIQEGGDGDRTITAIVAKFQNKADPPRKVSPAKSVIAHITYYEVNGQPYKFEIDKGAWVTEEYNHIDLAVGDTARLFIASQIKMGGTVNYQNNNDSSNPRWNHKLSAIPLEKEEFIVCVELVVRGNTEAGKIFKFRLTLKPIFMLEPLDLQESI